MEEFGPSATPIPTAEPQTGVLDYPDWLNGTPDWPVGSPEWCALATGKIGGLTIDLRLAVQTAYLRGATEWARLNYPQWIGWLESCEADAIIRGET